MKQAITAFISFQPKSQRTSFPMAFAETGRFFPTEADSLLSALEPFRNSQTFQVRIYDLKTPVGRLRGLLSGISESPAVIIAGERHVGLVAVSDALEKMLCDGKKRKPVT